MQTKDRVQYDLELMVDRQGLYDVVTMLTEICRGKAEHLESNWHDALSAKNWTKAAVVFSHAEDKLRKIQLP